MNNSQLYALAAPSMRPGDIIAFHGTELISGAIQSISHSPVTHIATVRQAIHGGADVVVTNSTIENGVSGPQSATLLAFLESEYPAGRAWWLTLAPSVRAKVDWLKFYQFIGACEGPVKYDWQGLLLYCLRKIPLIGSHVPDREDPRRMFCDAYAIAIMQACGAVDPSIDWRQQTPQDFLAMPFFGGCVQIWGAPAAIHCSLAA